ncbi:LacI family transcriptional regulator [Opitutaceae bacterium TAV5]|nr:LacI family transcriptional regulator [Opitutaceae bacterium TAV5]
MQPRVTVRDIAREVGLHFTTVARALNNHPRLPPATCKLVQDAAARMGYTPDPMLTALNAYRKTVRRPRYQATLAWIDNWPRPPFMFNVGEFREYFAGARARAATLGYKIEEFWTHEDGMTPAKLRRVLKARGIQGILMPPQSRPGTIFDFDLTGFSAVALGYSLLKPALHVVTNHQFRTMLLMLRNLDRLGYRRVGVCVGNVWDEKVGHNWKAGMLLADDTSQGRLSLAMLSPEAPARLAETLAAQPFDALVGYSDIHTFLRAHNARIPPFASLSVLEDDDHFSGTSQNSTLIGSKAVDLVVDMIHRSETGVPEQPVHTLIDSVWKTGKTLPPRQPSRRRQASSA